MKNAYVFFKDKAKAIFSYSMILLQNVELFKRNYANFVLSKNSHFSALTVVLKAIKKCSHQSGRTKFMYFLPFKDVCLDKLQTIGVKLFSNSRPIKFNWQHIKNHRDCFKSI